MYGDVRIQELPLSLGRMRSRMEAFLAENGLRPEPVDRYVVVTRGEEEEILAGGGLAGDVIKGVAVSEKARGENLAGPLVTHLLGLAAEAGHENVKVCTKPENEAVFGSLGFHVIGRSPDIVLLENGRGLEDYCRGLAAVSACQDVAAVGKTAAANAPGRHRCGVIVMNADPMTLGHEYLIGQAAARTERLHVIVLGGESSRFPASERFRMVQAVCRSVGPQVQVHEGGDYCISPATFPSYFLKKMDTAAEQQMRLDLDIFAHHIAPALGASVRFAGSEPLDRMTARYNALMRDILPQYGVDLVEIPRLETAGRPVSASEVRRRLDSSDLAGAMRLCPPRTWPFLLGDLAAAALRAELEVPGKPGMVCPDSPGSHDDMDEALMRRSIAALRPWFIRLGALGMTDETEDLAVNDRYAAQVRDLGLRAEAAMLRATGGVNTHRGALFALGLMTAAAGQCLREDGGIAAASLQRRIRDLAEGLERLNFSDAGSRNAADGDVCPETTHGAAIVRQHDVKGASRMALGGYHELFEDWLPYWRSVKEETFGPQKTLLRIMSSLDDTCVIRRAGIGRAQDVKAEAAALLADFSPEKLQEMYGRYVSERVSPGGSADMLALTMLADAMITSNL